jgi:hypothetical protein
LGLEQLPPFRRSLELFPPSFRSLEQFLGLYLFCRSSEHWVKNSFHLIAASSEHWVYNSSYLFAVVQNIELVPVAGDLVGEIRGPMSRLQHVLTMVGLLAFGRT